MNVLYYKVWSDLWHYKIRTLQVILIIGLGAFGVGLMVGARNLTQAAVAADWQTASPPAIKLAVNPPVSDEELGYLKNIPGVHDAEGMLFATIEWWSNTDGLWRSALLTARKDYTDQLMTKQYLVSGEWPRQNTFAMGVASDKYFGIHEGDTLTIRVDGRTRAATISGTLYAVGASPAFGDDLFLFTTRDHFAELTGIENYNVIQLRDRVFTQQQAEATDALVKARLEKLGIHSSGAILPFGERVVSPDVHPAANILSTIFIIMGLVGGVITILGLFLVYNSVSAILTQQVNQIGVMKAIGASNRQILSGYLLLVLIYGVLTTLISVPLSVFAAHRLKLFFVEAINLRDHHFAIDPTAVALQIAIAMLAPLLASLIPIFATVRITVREAISTYGLDNSASLVDRLVARLHRVPYTVLLMIGNTFRNVKRVFFTQITLVGSGLIFMAVLGVRDSTTYTFTTALRSIHRYDIAFLLEDAYRLQRLSHELLNQPEVSALELWNIETAEARSLHTVQASTDDPSITVFGPPAATTMYRPQLRAGRWLQPDDSQAVVLNQALADKLHVGLTDWVTLRLVSGKETQWQVVGLLFDPAISDSAYVPQAVLAKAAGKLNKANSVWIQTRPGVEGSSKTIALTLQTILDSRNLRVSTENIFKERTVEELSARKLRTYSLVIQLLAILVTMIATIGGIGLSGALSLSVLERTREIGVMRAIGASSGVIGRLFIGEGLLLGWLSWLVALPLSIPFAYLLVTRVVGLALNDELLYHFTLAGPLLWLVIITVLAILASWLPARSASQISVNESLAYQ